MGNHTGKPVGRPSKYKYVVEYGNNLSKEYCYNWTQASKAMYSLIQSGYSRVSVRDFKDGEK